ncbi:hypothetical protein CYY_002375 [Polysphondylium violaceum]|uniref:1-phosphatidylinositol 4-kinase n=1 Tax=Polysphondylium violaceum TaxID=133409 RepID=A0A8J4V9P2_9MYCE|nr:hypothetical protein CYY_002375 [Polysphondylium violaceum]
MLSLNQNSKNEFKALNSTVPEIFRLSAKVQLAETISFLNPISEDSVDILIQSCLSYLPNQQYQDIIPNNTAIKKAFELNPTLFSTMISIRSQESVIALSHLYNCSNGVIDDKAITILTSFLMYLTYFPTSLNNTLNSNNNNNLVTSNSSNTTNNNSNINFNNGMSQNEIQNAQNFTYYLVVQLALLSNISTNTRDVILPCFIEFFNHITKYEQLPIICGALQALGDCNIKFQFQQEELPKVILIIETIISSIYQSNKYNQKKILLLICNAFEQITYLPQDQVDSEIYKRIYNNIFPYISTVTDNDCFVSIVNVITRCGILDSSIGKEVLEHLIRIISDTKNLSENESIAALEKMSVYQIVLLSLVDLTDKYPEKTLRVVEVLKEFLCVSLIVSQNDEIRHSLNNAICDILRNEYRKERGIDVCKTVIVSLSNNFHSLYTEYRKNTPPIEPITMSNGSASVTALRTPSICLTSIPSLHSPSYESLFNITFVLGQLTCALKDLSITEIVLPNFMSAVTHYPPSDIENIVLEQLTDIALLEHPSITKDIVLLMTNLFKKIYKDPNQGLIANITPVTLERLAKHLVNDNLRQDLCKRVLKLFQQLGKTVRYSSQDPNFYLSSPILKGMGYLLPTISQLIKPSTVSQQQQQDEYVNNNDQQQQQDDTDSSIKLYRIVWFYCIFFKFSTQGTWRSDWYNSVQVIASHLAPLISTKPHIYLEMEVEWDGIIKQGYEKDYFIQLKNALIEKLPSNTTAYIKNLTLSQLAYVYSVYTLETMRSNRYGSFKTVFSYLEDQGIENINVFSCMRGIVDRAFNDFLLGYSNPQLILTSQQDLSDHASFLLVKFCYPFEPVRKAADYYISAFVSKFPQVLWSKDCLSTLLDLIEAIGKGARSKPMDMISVKMTNYPIIIGLPDESPLRQRLLQDIIALGNLWLKNASTSAPSEIQELLQEYMQKFNQLKRDHIGLSLAVEIGSNTQVDTSKTIELLSNSNNITSNPSAYPTCFTSNAANFVNSLQLKSMYSGEVRGMINMMIMDKDNEEENDDNDNLEEVVEELAFLRLIEDFEKIIHLHKRGTSIDNNAFISIMYRSSAFLINHYFGQSIKLLHLVCYAPAYIFTPESMSIGISCWKWLLAERPDLTIFIMTSLSDIWSWTVNQRVGLFTNTQRDPSPLAISSKSNSDESNTQPTPAAATPTPSTASNTTTSHKTDKTSDVPHKIWIDFLEERFSIIKYSSQEQLDIIIAMLHKSIADPDLLSVSPKSLGTRFKLLLLCMRLIQGDHIRDVQSARLLRQRVYLASLGWFYLPPIWYGPAEAGNQSQLEVDTKIMIDFCRCLQAEPIFQTLDKRFTISFKNPSAGGVGVGVSTGGISNSTSGGIATGGNNLGSGNVVGANQSSNSNSINSTNASTPVYGTLRNGRQYRSNSISSANSNSFYGNTLTSNINGGGVGVGHQLGSSGVALSSGNSNIDISASNGSNASMNSPDLLSSSRIIDIIGSGIGTMNSLNGHQISQSILDSMKSYDPNRPLSEYELAELRKRRNLILLLVGNELERMSAWNSPVSRISVQIPDQLKFSYDYLPKSMKSSWKDYLISAWKINPRLAIHFNTRFPLSKIRRIIGEMVVKNTKSVLSVPEALPFLVTEENVKANIPELKYLLYWETVTPPMAISLLGKQYQSHPIVSQYACRVLRSFPPETIMFYIPQLVQALRYDKSGQVENYLVSASKTSDLLAHQIVWNLQTYTEPDPNTSRIIDDPVMQGVANRLKDLVISEMDSKSFDGYNQEFGFFESFTSISGRLLQLKDPSKRKGQLKEELKMLTVNTGNNAAPLYLPTNPKSIVVGLEVESAMTLQSAAKVPILVNFKVIERDLPTPQIALSVVQSPPPSSSPPMGTSIVSTNTNNTNSLPNILKNQSPKLSTSTTNINHIRESSRNIRKNSSRKIAANASEQPNPLTMVHTQGCIFKSGDDIRQDMLALQIIDIFKRIFQSVGLDLYLFPYKVIATKPGCGMIELVPNTMSRDQIGKKVNGNLYNYFISKYGNKNSVGFQNARRNFIKSMAAYSVVSYILQIKDRHNANILVDEEGHIVHIDFGFIFDISPGGDLLTFEASPFKMNQEMIDIMGGKPNAEQFVWFMEQSVRAFLAARQHMDSIITLVELMLDTKLPCFRDQTIQNLRARFCPNKSETYAAKFMSKIVLDSFSTISTFSTYFYDVFQYYDNGIEM